MNATKLLIAVCSATAVFSAGPALAETIHLKNGTQIRGKIVKEDAKSFSVELTDSRRRVLKAEIETLTPPDPMVALVIGLVPGAGHIYVGDYARGAFFLGTSAVLGGGTYLAASRIRPSSPSTWAVAAIVAAEVPAILGAFDAYNQAAQLAITSRYRIDYDE